jgi:hypothetical protein
MLAGALLTGGVRACKYNVRDAGFVDFAPAPYRLVVLTNAATPPELASRLRAATADAWLDANVTLEFADAARPPAPLTPPGAAPAAFLLTPDGRALPSPPFPRRVDPAALWDFAEGIVVSPLRRRLLDALPEHFAVVLLLEGTDAAGNRRARAAAQGALERFADRLPRLPKPVKRPPLVWTLPLRGESPGDALALASLDLTLTNRTEPEAVVIYGRCRRCGPPLRGPDLTETALLEVLTILGQDCECDLDRSWMRGPMMPGRWDADWQRRVVAALGFDAESPLVKIEVERIISRGPTREAAARRVRFDAGGGLEALGYREMDLNDSPAETTSSEETAPAVPPEPSRPREEKSPAPAAAAPASPNAVAPAAPVAPPGAGAAPGARAKTKLLVMLAGALGVLGVGAALVLLFGRSR